MMEMEMEELAELRKEYRERKTAGLRAAIEARNEADKVLREELRVLGYRTPFTMWRDIA
jgi:hypothetical protein